LNILLSPEAEEEVLAPAPAVVAAADIGQDHYQ
jgi:hypothetical protein